MKGFTLRIVALIALAATSLAHGQTDAGVSGQTGPAGSVALTTADSSVSSTSDAWGQAADAVNTGADLLGKLTDVLKGILMDKKNAGTLVEKVSAALAKIPGMPSGRILQIKIMKGLGSALSVIDGVVESVKSVFKAGDAAFAGDREAYKKAVTKYIITMTGKIVGMAVGDAVFAGLTAATVGVGALPATGAGIVAGSLVDSATKFLLDTFAKDAIEDLVGRYYDYVTGGGSGGSDSNDPFDSEPENNGRGQAGTAPGGAGQGGSSGGGTTKPGPRRRGGKGGGDTSARLW